SGAQLCREVRKLDPNGPVFFCMASDRDEDHKRAERAGGSACLMKPLDPAQLRAQMTVWMELADVESIRAKLEEERAVQDEIVRRTQAVMARIAEARGNAVAAIERAARAKAYKAFIESGGTRANFDRWWPQVFGSARAASGLPGRGLA